MTYNSLWEIFPILKINLQNFVQKHWPQINSGGKVGKAELLWLLLFFKLKVKKHWLHFKVLAERDSSRRL